MDRIGRLLFNKYGTPGAVWWDIFFGGLRPVRVRRYTNDIIWTFSDFGREGSPAVYYEMYKWSWFAEWALCWPFWLLLSIPKRFKVWEQWRVEWETEGAA
jgi:hypothetical protein